MFFIYERVYTGAPKHFAFDTEEQLFSRPHQKSAGRQRSGNRINFQFQEVFEQVLLGGNPKDVDERNMAWA